MAALFLSEHCGAPVMLLALLIGMVFKPLAEQAAVAPGIGFSSKALLRTGVALFGMRVSVSDIASLGVASFGAVAELLSGTNLLGLLLSHRDWQSGVLTGGAVAICGASAAVSKNRAHRIPAPGFLIVFFALALLANTGLMTQGMSDFASDASKWLLIIAVSALGAKTSLRSLVGANGTMVARIGGLTVALLAAFALCAGFLPGLS